MNSYIDNFYSGCSGLQLPVPVSQFPPAFQGKSRLAYYSSMFNSIEINSIFYKLPRSSTVANWAASVPDHFRFTFKISKTITHIKHLDFAVKDVHDFISTVEHAGEKKGCLLAQFPPSLSIDKMDKLQDLLEELGQAVQGKGWKIAFEFRNPSWYEREVYELLDEYDVSLVIHDIPSSATPLHTKNDSVIYLRFHGPEPRYRGSYGNKLLLQYAVQIREWIENGKVVYAYFNNTVGDAVGNLQTLNKYVRMEK
jgi:uncharacterized protein YecE (DUF72 family)